MNAFSLDVVNEMPLAGGPLRQVITQIQHSQTPMLVSDTGEAAIAAELPDYPVRRRAVSATLNPFGSAREQIARTLSDASGDWVVTLTENSVSLQTTNYSSRDDFCSRAAEIFVAIGHVSTPPIVDRVGLRYINRIEGDDLENLANYVELPVQGMVGAIGQGMTLEHGVSDALITVDPGDKLQIRTGLLPAGAAFSPGLETSEQKSWVLDMDVFSGSEAILFDPEGLVELLRRYSEHAYSFFRWATTDELHKKYRQGRADHT